jgi:hypothetical protein
MHVFSSLREGGLGLGGVTALHDFQEIQYLVWWEALLLFIIGILIPILIFDAIPAIVRRGSRMGVSRHQKLASTILRIGAPAFVGLLSGWIFCSYGVTTEVTPTEVRIQFGWTPSYKEAIPLSEIQSAEAVRYNPMDYGGWGIKARSENDRVLSQRGDQAVRLQLVGGRQLLIGSQRPEALLDAIKRSRPQAGARP